MDRILLVSTIFSLGHASRELTICQGGACSRCGSKLFAATAQALACAAPAEAPVEVRLVSCLGPCPSGVAVKPIGTTSGVTVIRQVFREANAAALALEHAADLLRNEFDVDTTAAEAAVASKLLGDAAMENGDLPTAIKAYGEVVDAPLAGRLIHEAEQRESPEPEQLPRFGLTAGIAFEREDERLRPGRVRWLFEACLARCDALLTVSPLYDPEGAMRDARAAIDLCHLAGEGWYRLRAAAEASENAAAVAEASVELERLGYSLEPGEEGRQAADAKPAMKLDYWGRPMA